MQNEYFDYVMNLVVMNLVVMNLVVMNLVVMNLVVMNLVVMNLVVMKSQMTSWRNYRFSFALTSSLLKLRSKLTRFLLTII